MFTNNNQPDNQKNLLLAILLSVGVLLGWQYFYAGPKMQAEQERLRRVQQEQAEAKKNQAQQPGGQPGQPTIGGQAPSPTGGGAQAPAVPGAPGIGQLSRDDALKLAPRLPIATPSLTGSIALKGGRIDQLELVKYHETVDPKSPKVVLFSPAEAPEPYFAEYGWTAPAGSSVRVPNRDSVWQVEGGAKELAADQPVTLTWDNGQGLVFRRTIAVDKDYMFSITDAVRNTTGAEVTLFPYSRIYRYGTPKTQGIYILHEGLIGVVGDQGLQEIAYTDVQKDNGSKSFQKVAGGGWLGFTDKYWAAVLIPPQDAPYTAGLRLAEKKTDTTKEAYQADTVLEAVVIPANGTAQVEGKLFAGAKQVGIVDAYKEKFKIAKFDLMIDWGWFWYFTKPMFYVLEWLYSVSGNFGVAILLLTLIVKIVFFPLANKSYESMAKMKMLQPEMEKIRDRYKDDKMRQQQEMMALYQNQKVNPLSGCLPILIQIPVFFALYKVLFVTIDMRHAPFFGWIKDLSAPDPTSMFNLFGLLPIPALETYLLGHTIGAWAVVMGITMWLQMQLNPQQPDPVQQQIFNWMPVIFTVMLGGFASGLVIYWAWNNLLSIMQQSYIMHRQGADMHLLDNLKRQYKSVIGLGAKLRPGGKEAGKNDAKTTRSDKSGADKVKADKDDASKS